MRAIVCVLAVSCASALAYGASADEFLRCRQVADPAARLVCYDAVVIPAGAEATPTSASGPVPRPQSPRSPATGRPEAAAATGPASAPNLTQRFGLPSAAAPIQELPTLQSAIPGRFDGWIARARIRLANGQLWEISDGSDAAYDLRDPKVKITRGVSGTFFMEIEGVSQTPRVRRIE